MAPPPPCPLDAATRDKLLRMARGGNDGGVARRGDWVAVAGFDEAWHTAFATVRGVPADLVGRVHEVIQYAKALHDALTAAYWSHGLPLPKWRSWNSLVARWPFLSTPRPAPSAGRRVHVIRPL